MFMISIGIEHQTENIVLYFDNVESAQEFYHKAIEGFGTLNVVLRKI